jgi:hypothetical protein
MTNGKRLFIGNILKLIHTYGAGNITTSKAEQT